MWKNFSFICFKTITIVFLLTKSICAQIDNLNNRFTGHENPGCPYNSTCSKDLGNIFIKYEQSLSSNRLNSFFKKHGIPVTGRRLKKKESINRSFEAIWDSPCKYRDNKKSTFERVMYFARDFDKSDIIFPKYLLLRPNKNLITFKFSSDDSALGFIGSRLVFNRLVKDQYYQYQVSSKGKIRLKKNLKFKKFGQNIACAKNLLASIKDNFPKKSISKIHCRLIYNPNGDEAFLLYLPRCE